MQPRVFDSVNRLALIPFLIILSLLLLPGRVLCEVTHKVKQGENLYSIAKKHHLAADKLKQLNNLSGTKLKLGQVLVVQKDGGITKAGTKKNVAAKEIEIPLSETDGEFIEYRTKKGDTLDKIALRFGVDTDEIMEANELSSKKLSPGKTILIPKVPDEQGDEFVSLSTRPLKIWKNSDEKYMLVKVAKSFMGAPYKYGGESVRGLDCSAFVKKIYDIFDVQLPRSAREQFGAGSKIDKGALSVGDLVFFKTKRYVKYPTHVGIYIGDGNFIHSSSGQARIGVKIDALSSEFYAKAYIGAVRVKRPSEENADALKNLDSTASNS
jgi:peptidoglycan DL-endopeptidase LytE